MSMRGVEKQNSVAVTSAMLGVFQHEARTADGIPPFRLRSQTTRSNSGAASEVHEQADLQVGGLQVVKHLRLVEGIDFRPGFDLDDHARLNNQVGSELYDSVTPEPYWQLFSSSTASPCSRIALAIARRNANSGKPASSL